MAHLSVEMYQHREPEVRFEWVDSFGDRPSVFVIFSVEGPNSVEIALLPHEVEQLRKALQPTTNGGHK